MFHDSFSSMLPGPQLLRSRAIPGRPPRLPTELWALVFRHATTPPLFFDNRWENRSFVSSFEYSSLVEPHALLPHESFALSQQTNKSILLVCRRWNQIAYGTLLRRVVVRRKEQLEALTQILEQDALAHRSAFPIGGGRMPLGHFVTHMKIITTVNGLQEKAVLARSVRRLLMLCPNLQVLMDAAPYGLHEPSTPYLHEDDEGSGKEFERSGVGKQLSPRLDAIVWSYGGPDLAQLENELTSVSSLQCVTIHTPASLTPCSPITLHTLTHLDLSISWNNHVPWRFAAEHMLLPSLRHLTIRASAPGDSVLTSGAVESLDAFMQVHGTDLSSLDVEITPRAVSRTNLVFRQDPDATRDRTNIGALLNRCPNLVELVMSARWLSGRRWRGGMGVGGNGEADSPTSVLQDGTPLGVWRHPKLERVALRDVAPEGGDAVRLTSSSTSTAASSAVRSSASSSSPSLADRALDLLLAYQEFSSSSSSRSHSPSTTSSFFEWSVEILLRGEPAAEMSNRHASLAATMRAFIRTEREFELDAANSSSSTGRVHGPGHAEVSYSDSYSQSAFPALRMIRLLDHPRHKDPTDLRSGGGTRASSAVPKRMSEDDIFWDAWAAVLKVQNIELQYAGGTPGGGCMSRL